MLIVVVAYSVDSGVVSCDVKPRSVDVDANDVAAFKGELERTNITSNIVYWDSMLIVVVAHPVDSGIVPRDVKPRGVDVDADDVAASKSELNCVSPNATESIDYSVALERKKRKKRAEVSALVVPIYIHIHKEIYMYICIYI